MFLRARGNGIDICSIVLHIYGHDSLLVQSTILSDYYS